MTDYMHRFEEGNQKVVEMELRAERAEERAEEMMEQIRGLEQERRSLETLSQALATKNQEALRERAILEEQSRQIAYELRAQQDRSSE